MINSPKIEKKTQKDNKHIYETLGGCFILRSDLGESLE